MSHPRKQIQNLDIPFPQRHLLELEVTRDLEKLRPEDPRFQKDDLNCLEELHSTKLHKLLKTLDFRTRNRFEIVISFMPVVIILTFLTKEKFVVEFIREGGIGMYAVLTIGIFLLAREFLKILRLVVVKNHSNQNLRLDTITVVLGCSALVLLGLSATLLGIHHSAEAVMQSNLSFSFLVIGAKESLGPTILSSLLSAIVLFTHFGTRSIMRFWYAPISD